MTWHSLAIHSDTAMCRNANKFRILQILQALPIIFRLIFCCCSSWNVWNQAQSLQAKSSLLFCCCLLLFISLPLFSQKVYRNVFVCKEFHKYSCDNISKRLLTFVSLHSSCKVAYEAYACMHYNITKKPDDTKLTRCYITALILSPTEKKRNKK